MLRMYKVVTPESHRMVLGAAEPEGGDVDVVAWGVNRDRFMFVLALFRF